MKRIVGLFVALGAGTVCLAQDRASTTRVQEPKSLQARAGNDAPSVSNRSEGWEKATRSETQTLGSLRDTDPDMYRTVHDLVTGKNNPPADAPAFSTVPAGAGVLAILDRADGIHLFAALPPDGDNPPRFALHAVLTKFGPEVRAVEAEALGIFVHGGAGPLPGDVQTVTERESDKEPEQALDAEMESLDGASDIPLASLEASHPRIHALFSQPILPKMGSPSSRLTTRGKDSRAAERSVHLVKTAGGALIILDRASGVHVIASLLSEGDQPPAFPLHALITPSGVEVISKDDDALARFVVAPVNRDDVGPAFFLLGGGACWDCGCDGWIDDDGNCITDDYVYDPYDSLSIALWCVAAGAASGPLAWEVLTFCFVVLAE